VCDETKQQSTHRCSLRPVYMRCDVYSNLGSYLPRADEHEEQTVGDKTVSDVWAGCWVEFHNIPSLFSFTVLSSKVKKKIPCERSWAALPPSSFFKLPVALFPKYLELFFISKYAWPSYNNVTKAQWTDREKLDVKVRWHEMVVQDLPATPWILSSVARVVRESNVISQTLVHFGLNRASPWNAQASPATAHRTSVFSYSLPLPLRRWWLKGKFAILSRSGPSWPRPPPEPETKQPVNVKIKRNLWSYAVHGNACMLAIQQANKR